VGETVRVASLAFALYVFWLLLSGHTDAFLLGAGALAAVGIAFAGRVFGYTDREGHPVELILAGFRYWPWLAVEIAKSSVNVARIILSPSLPISPRLVKVRAGPETAVGMATYANSITLTPGTITVDTDRHHHWIVVHALTEDGVTGLLDGDMDRRVTRFEGRG
jgi:multicomponent Na+:H+ antiporter subunit E